MDIKIGIIYMFFYGRNRLSQEKAMKKHMLAYKSINKQINKLQLQQYIARLHYVGSNVRVGRRKQNFSARDHWVGGGGGEVAVPCFKGALDLVEHLCQPTRTQFFVSPATQASLEPRTGIEMN